MLIGVLPSCRIKTVSVYLRIANYVSLGLAYILALIRDWYEVTSDGKKFDKDLPGLEARNRSNSFS